ncbi:MAG: quinone-dependent dihydroorotate dehydrogenase, partial [Bacteroidetes bacterium]|nr:quinone-dependent dihydroorotate dehydrogenase [Bacteroidota bacterium]
GFGFIEIGTLTPLPQEGNPRPRLFRLISDHALINRMGFNNEGVIAAVDRLKKRKSKILVGGNIGKNKATPNENAADDYKYCFEALYPFVDYFVVNVSSPNTPGLRALQDREPLKALLLQVKALSQARQVAKPIFLKISPDLNVQQLDDVIEILTETGTDGVIATNTTVSREGLQAPGAEVEALGSGGLSGQPLTTKSNGVVKYLRRQLPPGFPIIGVGGIMSEHDALERIRAGADLIQIYTGFIYEGPMFVRRLKKAIAETVRVSS